MTNREAIEALGDLLDTTKEYPHLDGMTMFGDAISLAISALEKDRWIPVSERPKKDGKYQVTRLDYVTDTKFIDNLWYEKNTWWNRQATGDYAVTAWRPLPEPYTEDEA